MSTINFNVEHTTYLPYEEAVAVVTENYTIRRSRQDFEPDILSHRRDTRIEYPAPDPPSEGASPPPSLTGLGSELAANFANFLGVNATHSESVDNRYSAMQSLVVLSRMARVLSYNASLEEVLRQSAQDAELRRDEKRHIQVTSERYESIKDCEIDNCIICSDKFQKESEVSQLKCKHVFHSKCIKEWGHYNPTCPLCKKSIPLKNLVKDK